MSQTSVIKAIAMNNEGANLLQSGKTVEAMRVFRKSLIALQNATSHNESCCDTATECPNGANGNREERCSEQTTSGPTVTGVLLDAGGPLVLFSRPLVYPTEVPVVSNGTDLTTFLKSTVSSYVIFNLALACHQHGLTTGQDSVLDRACHLYHISSISAQPLSTELFVLPQSILPCALLQALAYNNLAHLYFNRCDCNESVHCMLECMERVDGRRANCYGGADYLVDSEAEDIALNGLLLLEMPSCAARAA